MSRLWLFLFLFLLRNVLYWKFIYLLCLWIFWTIFHYFDRNEFSFKLWSQFGFYFFILISNQIRFNSFYFNFFVFDVAIIAENLTFLSNLQFYRNPSSSSIVTSETGSLDRMKAAAERRKKGLEDNGPPVSGRVEDTRVNPDSLIDELLKNTKLDQLEESAESKFNRIGRMKSNRN